MIRLIISDIDGTLVPESGSNLNPEYMDVIRELTGHGVAFAAASGRHTSSIDAIFREVRELIYYLGDNGACIKEGGKTVKEIRMNGAYVEQFLKETKEIPDCFPLLSTRDGFYTDGRNKEFEDLVFGKYRGAGGPVRHLEDYADQCIKLSLYREEGSQKVYDLLVNRWKDRFAMNISGAKWVDFNDYASTKGNAVRWIQEQRGITPEETMVFGDNFNDISMMERAGRSYASVLSHPDVKKAAGREVASYEEDGVLQVLKQVLKEIVDEEN